MKNASLLMVVALIGLLFGGVSALYAAGLWPGRSALAFSDVDVDGWRSDWNIGTPAANPYLRARIARHGLLALSRDEAVYFTRRADDAGRPLVERCTYRVRGEQQQAAWWSITLYDSDSRLPANDDQAYSIDATKVADASEWSAILSTIRPPRVRHWLSTRNAGRFDLTLRLYRPSETVLSDPDAAIRPPHIERLSCDEPAS